MNSVVFFLRKTSTIHISNFCFGMPLRKVHELTFLWFGLPGPLLKLTLHLVWPGIAAWGKCAGKVPVRVDPANLRRPTVRTEMITI